MTGIYLEVSVQLRWLLGTLLSPGCLDRPPLLKIVLSGVFGAPSNLLVADNKNCNFLLLLAATRNSWWKKCVVRKHKWWINRIWTRWKVYGTRSSQAVPHPSTILARRCLTSVIRRERVYSSWYGRRHRHLELSSICNKQETSYVLTSKYLIGWHTSH